MTDGTRIREIIAEVAALEALLSPDTPKVLRDAVFHRVRSLRAESDRIARERDRAAGLDALRRLGTANVAALGEKMHENVSDPDQSFDEMGTDLIAALRYAARKDADAVVAADLMCVAFGGASVATLADAVANESETDD